MKFTYRILPILLVVSAFLAACGSSEVEESTPAEEANTDVEQLQLYTTIYPLEDFATKIGGEFVNVTNLVPVGSDAHTFEPTAKEMIEVAEGDAFIYNGAGLEGFADAVIATLENEDVAVVEASEGISLLDSESVEEEAHAHEEEEAHAHEEEEAHAHEEEEAHAHEEEEAHAHEEEEAHAHEEEEAHAHEEEEAHAHEEEEAHAHEEEEAHAHSHDEDPHLWIDPILAITLAENIKNALVELMPEQEQTFTDNFNSLKADLEALDADFQAMVDASSKKTFLVSHAGYGYWEERYGLEQIGISGMSPTEEPSQKQLEEIINYAQEYDLNYVMLEQNIPTKLAEVVQEEVGAETLYLHNLEALVEEDVSNNEDYFSLMRKNIEALEMALK
ncbi:metal ABC transporter solute-binding protein, Zn/Mn family [Bacillus suaedae]|uniref:Zinc ABC transporter substrate-binding protein n=1 Tax=Halalkalibacter suaedae TaxID=2822140 RepID=A0A940X061_9BACI|nr:zinc ABC transporter substrate-binding protein [Bacillus suaedae]MBP3952281.1 zinc ABC transporter substrate-binding protein [Bacillus suaedae]